MRTLEDLVPESLHDEYLDNEIVHAVFQLIRCRDGSREDALVLSVKELVKHNDFLLKELKNSLLFQPPTTLIIKKDTCVESREDQESPYKTWQRTGKIPEGGL